MCYILQLFSLSRLTGHGAHLFSLGETLHENDPSQGGRIAFDFPGEGLFLSLGSVICVTASSIKHHASNASLRLRCREKKSLWWDKETLTVRPEEYFIFRLDIIFVRLLLHSYIIPVIPRYTHQRPIKKEKRRDRLAVKPTSEADTTQYAGRNPTTATTLRYPFKRLVSTDARPFPCEPDIPQRRCRQYRLPHIRLSFHLTHQILTP